MTGHSLRFTDFPALSVGCVHRISILAANFDLLQRASDETFFPCHGASTPTIAHITFHVALRLQHYKDGQELHRARATAAGFIMTAIFNFVLLIAVGSEAPAEDSQEKGQNCQYPPQYTAEHV